MKHYELTEWVDFVRGLGDARSRADMEEHRQACRACREACSTLERVALAAAADQAFEPPDWVVRRARAVASQRRPEHMCALPRLLVRLVRDGLQQPLAAGVRGNARAARQSLLEAGGIYVDLRVEQLPGRPAVVLVGQLLCPGNGNSASALARQPVVLTSGDEVLAATASNEHGEFHLEYVPADRMRLHIPVEDGTRRIEIRLNRLAPRARVAGNA
jgi:hypothetical protein